MVYKPQSSGRWKVVDHTASFLLFWRRYIWINYFAISHRCGTLEWWFGSGKLSQYPHIRLVNSCKHTFIHMLFFVRFFCAGRPWINMQEKLRYTAKINRAGDQGSALNALLWSKHSLHWQHHETQSISSMLHIALLFALASNSLSRKKNQWRSMIGWDIGLVFFLICFLFLGVLEVFINFTSGLSLRSNFFGLRCVCFHMSACRNQSAKRKLVS